MRFGADHRRRDLLVCERSERFRDGSFEGYGWKPHGRFGGLFGFFETPAHFDEKFKKKSCKEDTAEVLETLITILDTCPDFKSETTEGAVKAWIEGNEWGFGKVMSPFRLAVVGEGKGPSVFDMIEVIGKDETLKRIGNLVKELRFC